MNTEPAPLDTAADIVRALLDIIEGDDAEWLSTSVISEQAATVQRAKDWLTRGHQ